MNSGKLFLGITGLLLALLFLSGCTQQAPPQDTACTQEYAPVCGEDGKTYSNSCMAGKAGVTVDYAGECRTTTEPAQQGCTKEYDPVCGTNGQTYSNACLARQAGAIVDYEGECRDTVCTLEYAPVCGTDGETYSNDCFAAQAGADVAYEGECRDGYPEVDAEPGKSESFCPPVVQPVCGSDGKMYQNSCLATVAGATIVNRGECQ